MRVVDIAVPPGQRDMVLRVLDDEGIDYTVVPETSRKEYTAVISFPLPTSAVEPVLDQLESAGLGDDAATVVLDAQTVISQRYDRLEQRFEEQEDRPPENRRPRQEIRTRARELAPYRNEFIVMTVLSIAIATAGILLDSVAVVVGSMVIAPLIGPAMTTNVGTVLGDREMFTRGVELQVLGGVLGVATATVLAFVVKTIHVVPPGLELFELTQVRGRLAPGLLSLIVALGSGVAGAYSLTSGLSSALVGVAIAVALVPPTAVIGVGIAYLEPTIVLGATLLVLVNFFSINLGALAVLWYQGYRPAHPALWEQVRSATIRRAATLLVAIVILTAFLGGVTYFSYQAATTEQAIRDDVRTVLDRPAYEDLTLIDIAIDFEDPVLRRNPERVIVTVGHAPGTLYPDLAEAIAAEIEQRVTVEVRFTVRAEA